MSSRGHSAGKDVDAFCGKCQLTLSHIIMAMNGTRIARVQCKTCHATHSMRAAPGSTATGAAGKSTGRKDKADPAQRATRAARSSAAEFARLAGSKDLQAPVGYRPSASFKDGAVLSHPSFGLGIVIKVQIDRIQAVFAEHGLKVLVQAKPTT